MHNKSIAELQQILKKKQLSCVELTEHYLKRIKTLDPSLNSFITLNEEGALAQAHHADKHFSAGTNQPLTGIPIAHKDIFCTDGIRTTCGSKMLEHFIAPYSATVIERFNDAGAILIGRTNMDEFAMGSSNENSYFGPVKNPWDTTRTPGGSSGGSAAAVAARLVPGATGTDTGGSVRQPAALSGICGLKPTYGRVSRYGMVAFASSLDQGSPLAHSAEDLAILMNIMAGYDKKDSTSLDKSVPNYTSSLSQPLNGLKIGLPKEYFEKGLDPAIENLIEEARRTLEGLGAQCIAISLPHTALATSAYYVLAPAECSSNLARYDGIRYGYRCDNPKNLQDLYERTRTEGFGPEVKRRILIGTYVLSAGYYDAYYLKAQKVRNLIRNDFVEAFKIVDTILTPTSPTVAFKLGERVLDPVAMYLSDVFTIAVNLAGLPGLSFPVGFSKSLPVGAQLIGNYFDEARLLNIAHQYQQRTSWHQHSPFKD